VLSDARVKAAKPKDRAYKLTDGGGLVLFIAPIGSKLWQLRYTFQGKEKLLSLGPYPNVSLANAREQREAAKALLRSGKDPSLEKKLRRAAGAGHVAGSFEAIARDWHTRNTPTWTERHAKDVLDSLEADVFPVLGQLPVNEITPPMVLGVLRAIEARPALETARRVRQRISAVFVNAIALGIGTSGPAAIVKGAMAPMVKGRQLAITELVEARKVLAAAEAIAAHPTTKLANRLLALTVVRPGELRAARWGEFEELDGPEPLWGVPAERMKMKREHLVPLSGQAVAVLAAIRPLTGRNPFVFPSTRHAHHPMSENAIGYLLNRAGYYSRHVPHGWRATFSSIMNERHRADRHVIDLMLAHAPQDRTEAAYNRAVPRRRERAQEWADTLLEGALDPSHLIDGRRRWPAAGGRSRAGTSSSRRRYRATTILTLAGSQRLRFARRA
jgi:integrase